MLLFIPLWIAGCDPQPVSAPPTLTVAGFSENSPLPDPIRFATSYPALIPDQVPTTIPTLVLSDRPYLHPSGLIEIYPPSGWMATQEQAGLSFQDPEGLGILKIRVANAGYPLRPDALVRFIAARELNEFGNADYFQTIGQQVEPESERLTKNITLDGEAWVVESRYLQQGPLVWFIDLWANQEVYPSYRLALSKVTQSARLSNPAVDDLSTTFSGEVMTYDLGHISLELPAFWRIERTASGNSSVVTFYSPDEHALLQVIVFDDGMPVSRSVAGAFTLEILREYYTNEISVTGDRVWPDGREFLSWRALDDDIRGMTTFEVRETAIVIITGIVEDEFQEYYFDLLERILQTHSFDVESAQP